MTLRNKINAFNIHVNLKLLFTYFCAHYFAIDETRFDFDLVSSPKNCGKNCSDPELI